MLMSDYRAINVTIEQATMLMPNLETLARLFDGAHALCTLDLLQEYWKTPLSPEVQALLTMVMSDGLNTPRRVPQGVLNAIPYSQGVMRDVLDELRGSVWCR